MGQKTGEPSPPPGVEAMKTRAPRSFNQAEPASMLFSPALPEKQNTTGKNKKHRWRFSKTPGVVDPDDRFANPVQRPRDLRRATHAQARRAVHDGGGGSRPAPQLEYQNRSSGENESAVASGACTAFQRLTRCAAPLRTFSGECAAQRPTRPLNKPSPTRSIAPTLRDNGHLLVVVAG